MKQPVAKITKPFGAEQGGGVILSLYTEFPEDFSADTEPLFALVDGLWVPLWCERFDRRGATGAQVTFADLDNAKRLSEFIGRELFIERDVADDDEFYMEDLIGFAVQVNSGERGEITDFYDNEANPLIEITVADETFLVPAVEEFFTHIDFESRRVVLTLPEGLLEVQRNKEEQ
jgi:16S rRNA processing protein RimM